MLELGHRLRTFNVLLFNFTTVDRLAITLLEPGYQLFAGAETAIVAVTRNHRTLFHVLDQRLVLFQRSFNQEEAFPGETFGFGAGAFANSDSQPDDAS